LLLMLMYFNQYISKISKIIVIFTSNRWFSQTEPPSNKFDQNLDYKHVVINETKLNLYHKISALRREKKRSACYKIIHL